MSARSEGHVSRTQSKAWRTYAELRAASSRDFSEEERDMNTNISGSVVATSVSRCAEAPAQLSGGCALLSQGLRSREPSQPVARRPSELGR